MGELFHLRLSGDFFNDWGESVYSSSSLVEGRGGEFPRLRGFDFSGDFFDDGRERVWSSFEEYCSCLRTFDFGLGESFVDVDSEEVSSSPSPMEARIRTVIRSLSCDRAFSVDLWALDLGLDGDLSFFLGPLVDFPFCPGRLVASSFGEGISGRYQNKVQ